MRALLLGLSTLALSCVFNDVVSIEDARKSIAKGRGNE